MLRRRNAALTWLCFVLSSAFAQTPESIHTVESMRSSFRLADDSLTIEIVASEPYIVDPVAVAWDEDGRMYVAEMRDYPSGPASGTIRILFDDDHDGHYERSNIFAEGLPFPSSVLPHNGGLLVTAAPDILFLRDLNGDGSADDFETVLTGFGEGNPQLRVNGLLWGLDNWVYAANGRSDGNVRRPDDPAGKTVSIRLRDIRFKPDGSAFEPIMGMSQFGLARDDWGNRFLSFNTVPIRHAVIEDRYLLRNPKLPAMEAVAQIAYPNGTGGRLFPIVASQQRFNQEPVDYFNAGCGPAVYRGDALPAYYGHAFICEPLTSLVHRRKLAPQGATFVARRADEGKEFLASTDHWFRPVNLATGPDGALYVVDYAREWVEHPDFVPEDQRGSVDWRVGSNLGRIWRIRPKEGWAVPGPKKLSEASTAELVGLLDDANGWMRDTAQRLLVTRGDKSAVEPLSRLASAGRTPQARAAALWTLEGLQALDDSLVESALRDSDANVRKQAIILAEPRLAQSEPLASAIVSLAGDPDPVVRFQLAIASGFLPVELRAALCSAILKKGASDSWTALAIASSAGKDSWPVLRAVLHARSSDIDYIAQAHFDVLAQLAECVGATNDDASIDELASWLGNREPLTAIPDIALFSGLARGLQRAGRPLREVLKQTPSPVSDAGQIAVSRAFAFAEAIAANSVAAESLRHAAVHVIAQQPGPDTGRKLLDLLNANSDAVQRAAVESLRQVHDEETVNAVFDRWNALPAGARRTLISGLVSFPSTARSLLEAIDAGRLPMQEIEHSTRDLLLAYPVEDVRQRATALLLRKATPTSAEKESLLAQYREAINLQGDLRRGAAIFAANCLPCHNVQGFGQEVGPDLASVNTKTGEQLLMSILDPSAEVTPDYISYTIETEDFEVLSGVLAAENANSVTLKQAMGIVQTIERSKIVEMTASEQSIMPEGLEAAIDVQGMADLLHFLQNQDRAVLESVASTVISPP